MASSLFPRFGRILALPFLSLALGSGCRAAAHPNSATQRTLALRDYDTSRYRELVASLHQIPGVYDVIVDASKMQVVAFAEPTVTAQTLSAEAAKHAFHLDEGNEQGSYIAPAGWSEKSDVIFLNADGEDFPAVPLSNETYTVVEFFADWCQPCHLLSNEMKRLLAKRQDIALRVIDIGQFDSPAHRHWALRVRSLPYVIIYTPQAKVLVQQAGFKPSWIEATIDDHRRSAGKTSHAAP